ncbi:MAG: hypothetical protein AB7P76_03240 [Candidatus Melainabacteria bacterium]
MGLAASQARLLMLTARKSDLEFQLQIINQARMQLSNMVSSLFSASANLTPGNPFEQRLNAQFAVLQSRDKMLELQANQVNTQHEAVQTEVEAVRKVISQNIQGSFKLMS